MYGYRELMSQFADHNTWLAKMTMPWLELFNLWSQELIENKAFFKHQVYKIKHLSANIYILLESCSS